MRDAPGLAAARMALGLAYSAGGHTDQAVEQWEEIVRRNPEHRTAQFYLKMAKPGPDDPPPKKDGR